MDIGIKLAAGGCYLLQKIFLWIAERIFSSDAPQFIKPLTYLLQKLPKRTWKIASWIAVIIGLGPWVYIFIHESRWIAAIVEACGFPAMALGFVNSIRGKEKKSPMALRLFAWLGALIGLGISIAYQDGLNTLFQWLEIALVTGYLIGTERIAHDKPSGYLWFILMHVSCAWLMFAQHETMLGIFQILSLLFIIDAYSAERKVHAFLK